MVGLRSWEDQEIDLIENGGLNVYPAALVAERGMKSVATSVYSKLSACDAVHISLDIDCLDPAFAPGVSHREPGGLSTRQAIDLIQRLKGKVIGADIVEFNPRMDPLHITGTVCAKILKEIAARMLE